MRTLAVIITAAAMSTVMTASSSADPRLSRDDLMPLPQDQRSVDMRPKSDHRIDMLTAAKMRRRARLWQTIDITTLTVSTAAIACDWAQTHKMAADGWRAFYNPHSKSMQIPSESNPIMGSNPSSATVDGYFIATIAINTAIWYFMPPKYRSALPLAVIAFQANAIAGNAITTDSICGL